MKKILSILIIIISIQSVSSQQMTPKKIETILERVADSIKGNDRQWTLKIKETILICITDDKHNRMRIISPITEAARLDEKLKSAALVANFHTALDVKYAIADDVLWSVFIHPLKELTEAQVLDAVSQVYSANLNFGTSFSSTALVFPGGKSKKAQPKIKRLQKI